jgi:ABC-type glutathione transport system ATPase component
VLGIVGESGSGKSVTMMALMGLIAWPGRVRAKTLRFAGHDLLGISDRERRRLVGKDMAMIFQEPTTSLNPCFTIGYQLVEALRLHSPLDKKSAQRHAIELLEQVGIPAAASRMNDYPHQLSGGMNQRVMIAMAISCNPRLLIADEPTTALDVTIQAQILDLLRNLQKERGMALVLITHNMGVVSEMAQRIAVMYAGQVMEQQPVDALFARRSIPTPRRCWRRCRSRARPAIGSPPFPAWCPACSTGPPAACSRRAAPMPPRIRAPCGPSCAPGRAAGALPLSAGRSVAAAAHRARRPVRVPRPWHEPRRRRSEEPAQGLPDPPRHVPRAGATAGGGRRLLHAGRGQDAGGGRRVRLRQVDAGAHGGADREAHRRHADARRHRCGDTPPADRRRLRQAVQLVFQNPYGSLNPRKKISAVLEAPLAINTDLKPAERAERARAMLAQVGLRPEHANRYPHMFSGGQRQRIAIARALMPGPKLVVADEPVSALDVSIQAQVLNLLSDLQQEFSSPTCSSRTTWRWCATSRTTCW